MLVKLFLLTTFMAGISSPSLSTESQYTLPVSVPIRFDLPGSYVNVRRIFASNTTATGGSGRVPEIVNKTSEVSKVAGSKEAESNKRKRKARRRNKLKERQDDYGDPLLENQEEYKHVSRWSTKGWKRRRNRFNRRGKNQTSSHYPKKNRKKGNWNARRTNNKGRKSGPAGPTGPTNRKSTAPNRPTGGRPAGGRYRSVDPRQEKVQRHILRFHNILRSHVEPSAADMLAVGWYETAAEQAQAWAEQCGPHTETDHPAVRWTSRYGACGQNVLVSSRKRRWSYVLRRWWSGRRYFHFGDETNNSSVVSAYTQMAWYNSHQVGCGFAECSTTGGSTFFRYVCNYCPAGNDPRRLSRPYTHGQTCRRCPTSCRSMCSRGQCKLCTNACLYSDLWVNCANLNKRWHEWLCNTKTLQGVERFQNCRATCQCMKRIM